MKKKKKWLRVVIVLAVIAAAVIIIPRMMLPEMTDSTAVSSYTVGRGDVEVTITGSGKLEADDTTDILLPEGIKVDTIFVKQGDLVQEGDVLATLNTASLQYRAAELSAELTTLDQQLATRRTTSNIKAPAKGRIKYLPASVDDDVIEAVNQYGALAILSTDGLMQVELKTTQKLSLNAKVTVKWNGGSVEGKVASKIDGGYLITCSDEKAPYQAIAEIFYDASLIGTGELAIHSPLAIFGNGGTIATVNYKVNNYVEANAYLFTLSNAPATDAYRQALADRDEKASQLQSILMYQNNPNVVADVSGTVNSVAISEGKKTVSKDNSGELTAFTLGTGGATKMIVKVDELDIGKVSVGQSATIALDAFSTEEFTATVVRISHIGEATGSITTYETELKLNYDARLRDGMNGSAVILSDSVQNVVIVPLGAINEDADGSYVYKLDSADNQIKVYITTGLSDGNYAEVVRGLSDGDRIAYSVPGTTNTITGFPAPGEFPFGG